jgi:hypothetical protein
VLLKEVMSNVPITMVVRHVKTNNATLSQGNFCCGASSSSISAEGLNVLSMKDVFLFSAGSSTNGPPSIEAARFAWGFALSRSRFAPACAWRSWNPERLKRLQILAGLEPYGLSRRYIHFRTCAGVSANARLPRLDGKYTKAAQLDPVVGFQGILHAIKNRIHSLFSFCLADSCPLDDLIHKIEFDHWNLRFLR